MAGNDQNKKRQTFSRFFTTKVSHQNLATIFDGLILSAKQAEFIFEDGTANINPEINSLTRAQNALVNKVLALDMTSLIDETDHIIAEADRLAPQALTTPVHTFKEVLALSTPIGYVENDGLNGMTRNQAEIDAVVEYLRKYEKDSDGAWIVTLVGYYQVERLVYNTLQALRKANADKNFTEVAKQASLLFGYIFNMRQLAEKEMAIRPPFLFSRAETPILTLTYTPADFDATTLEHFISKELVTKKATDFIDLKRVANLFIGKQYLIYPNDATVETALSTAEIELSVSKFIKDYAHQNGISWGGINWLQSDYLGDDYTLVDRSTRKFIIITPQENGSVEFRAVYYLKELTDINKSVESSAGSVNVNLGKGLVLDTVYTISPKKEGEEEASVALKSHSIHVLDKKVYNYIPTLKPASVLGQALKRSAVALLLTVAFVLAALAVYFFAPPALLVLTIPLVAAGLIALTMGIAQAVTVPKQKSVTIPAIGQVETAPPSKSIDVPAPVAENVEATASIMQQLEADQKQQMQKSANKLKLISKDILVSVLKALEDRLVKLGDSNISAFDNSVDGILDRIEKIFAIKEINGKVIDIIKNIIVPLGLDFIKNQQDEKLDALMQCVESWIAPRNSDEYNKINEAFDKARIDKPQAGDLGLSAIDKSKFKKAASARAGLAKEQEVASQTAVEKSPTISTRN
jgi:hypothetical protein